MCHNKYQMINFKENDCNHIKIEIANNRVEHFIFASKVKVYIQRRPNSQTTDRHVTYEKGKFVAGWMQTVLYG
jgi:hypothetical protein